MLIYWFVCEFLLIFMCGSGMGGEASFVLRVLEARASLLNSLLLLPYSLQEKKTERRKRNPLTTITIL